MLLRTLIAISLVTSTVLADVEIDSFEPELKTKGISLKYSDDSLTKLGNLILDDINKVIATAEATQDEKEIKKAKKFAGNIAVMLGQITAKMDSGNASDRTQGYRNLLNLAYSTRSEIIGPQKNKGGLGNIFGGNLDIQYIAPANRMAPLTAQQLVLEASDLYDPLTEKTFSSPTELTGLSSEEISNLDVRPDNPLWFTEKELAQIELDYSTKEDGSKEVNPNWKRLEKRMEAEVSKAEGIDYKLNIGRRIVEFKNFKTSATSPKLSANDAFGQDWKVKWSEEMVSENISNRLYMKLGGKIHDLVYANLAGPKELILILNKESAESADPKNCEKISTVEKFKSCFLTSAYTFDVSPYILKSGKIDEAMINDSELTFGKIPQEARDKWVGRTYITFKQSMVEFQPDLPVANRLGAASFNVVDSVNDRAKRGLVAFSYWIANKDAKDGNNRAMIFDGQYLESMHDIGGSLGKWSLSATANNIDPLFASVKGNKMHYEMGVLYKPQAFLQATFADQLWMVRKILKLTLRDLHEIAMESRLPLFVQMQYISKLVSRRNNLVDAYGIGSKMDLPFVPHATTSADLSTPDSRLQVVRDYDLAHIFGSEQAAVSEIERFMIKGGLKLKDGYVKYVDTLGTISNNVLTGADCSKSVIVSLLETYVYPVGFNRHQPRRDDHKPMSLCVAKGLKAKK